VIYLAYDGSLNGDWVFRYALRFAAHPGEGALTLVHVRDVRLPNGMLEAKVDRIRLECSRQGVDLRLDIRSPEKSVFQTLVRAIPPGRESFVLCGTRVRSRQKAFLAGTVSEKLLGAARFQTLALRVVQPGLLGFPRVFLIPLAGHPRGFKGTWPFFHLFLPEVVKIYLLRGMVVGTLRLGQLSLQQTRTLREAGAKYLQGVVEEILRWRGEVDFALDSRVSICDDWVGEILVQASKLKARMILLGASEQPLAHRLTHRNALERVLRGAPCDVGIYRSL
jgi:hypothetical protein